MLSLNEIPVIIKRVEVMKEEQFKNIFLSNMDIDKNSYDYQKILMTNIILYIAGSVFFLFFIVNTFINQKVFLGVVEGVFTIPIIYIWYQLRANHNVDFASTFAVLTVVFAALATVFVSKAESFSILWSFTLPFATFTLKGNRDGMKFLLLFYGILFPYIFMNVGELFSWIEFMRFSAVTIVVILIAYFFAKIVHDAYNLLHKSHQELSHSNYKIQSSIYYATNIQKSFLPPCDVIHQNLYNSFVIWQPKDIVSGDLYLYGKNDKGILIGVADCTGHGVSGGFMTMLVGSSFKRLRHKSMCDNPALILQEINKEVRAQLNQNRKSALSDDGLDMGLCFINEEKNVLTFAGAKIDLVSIQNGEVTTIKGDKQSLGYKRSRVDYEYTNHSVKIDQQSFYLYSDGIIDQIGGERRFLYGNKRFKKFLLTIQDQSFDEQKISIHQELVDYQGDEERRDDVTIVGFKANK